VVGAAETAYHVGADPLAAVEGVVRQVIGWRDYIWHLYWYLGEDYRANNRLNQRRSIDDWFAELDPAGTDAACVRSALTSVRETGWTHHIPRLMVLGNYAMQHRWKPQQVTDWFHRAFVDGYDWVMVPNVVGMSQHADGGILATKPYVSGGAYIDTMSDHCGGCRFDPKKRVGEDACPFTGGYWRFLHRHRERFAANPRMGQMVRGLDRLKDLDQVLAEEP
jgi:deoxyribodipyrimidine photolyase-related protein